MIVVPVRRGEQLELGQRAARRVQMALGGLDEDTSDLDAIDDLQRPEELDADEMLEDACGAMSCAPAPPEELQEMEALEDANEEIESIEDAADAELLEDASAAVAAPGGPFEDVAVAPPAPPSPPRTRYPLLTRFMECIGSRM